MRIIFVMLFVAAALAADDSIVTIYSDGYAVIRESRTLSLNAGDNTVTISDLPMNVLGESFQIGGDGLSVRQFNFLEPREANYSFEGFLKDLRGKTIGFKVDSVTTAKGKLLQATDTYIFIQSPDSVVRMYFKSMLRDWSFVNPTLQETRKQAEIRCELGSDAAGSRKAELRYEAAGMQWDARYRLLLNDDSTGFLEGWASILNRSGKTYSDCDVVLVEGNLGRYRNLALGNRLDENQIASIVGEQAGFKMDPSGGVHIRGGRDTEVRYLADGQGVEITTARKQALHTNVASSERRITGSELQNYGAAGQVATIAERVPAATYSSERHGDLTLYGLPFEATLKDSAQTEVVLLEQSKVKAFQIYSFNGLDISGPAAVTLQLVNKEQEGLGLALPAAELQLFRNANNGLEQFVGSYRLERTQAGDTVRVNLGGDPEIMCSSVITKQEGEKRIRDIEFEHTMKNTKSDTVVVACKISFNGEITVEDSSTTYSVRRLDPKVERDDLKFSLVLPPNEEVKSHFAVRLKLPK